jgi:succinyl-CoA synthetase alpha subunit
LSILIDRNTRLLIQGITGHEGLFHADQMLRYGSTVVAGVTPGKGGEWVLGGKIPVFDSVKTAVEATGANASIIFVPARYAMDALFEVVESDISLVVCITKGIPIQDVMKTRIYYQRKGTRLIGPNCPGVLTPGEAKAGIIPENIAISGNIGVVSRSGTLTYEVLYALKQVGMGVSTCVGIGGDPVQGSNFVDILELFENDPHTDQVVLIGEIGGNEEELAAEYISQHMTKPVVGLIVGQSAPIGKRMGHSGAIIESGTGFALDKVKALQSAGVRVARHPGQIPELINR